jgi:ribosomal protein S27AE
MASFACPRCSKAFFENWYFFKPLRQNCAHCSLTRWAKEMPPPAVS